MHTLLNSALALLLVGCASTSQVADTAVRTNMVQEQAHNQLLLLNVLRAYGRKPMHFTQVSAVRLPPGAGNSNFTLPIPLGADRTHLYTLGTALSVQQSVDTIVLNSQEFTRGITSPVQPSLMLYYLDQGWPQQLVLHMFVRSIEFYEGSKLVDRVTNYPENRTEFERFQRTTDSLRRCEFDASPELVSRVFYSSILSDGDMRSMKDIAAARAAGLVPVGVDSAGEPANDPALRVGHRFAVDAKATGFTLSTRPESEHECAGIVAPSAPAAPFLNVQIGTAGDPSKPKERAARFMLRSPEAMLYYLGEIARAQIEGQFTATTRTRVRPEEGFPSIAFRPPRAPDGNERTETLFQLKEGVVQNASLAVEYEGKAYSIPQSSSHNRSMHVLSLLSQVLSLQNRGLDSPTTTNVRVVQ